MLRVNYLPLKLTSTGELWRVALIVTVISSATINKVTGYLTSPLTMLFDAHSPSGAIAIPGNFCYLLIVANMPVNLIFMRGLTDIIQYRRTIGNRSTMLPWFKAIAQGVHIRIGPNAGITE